MVEKNFAAVDDRSGPVEIFGGQFDGERTLKADGRSQWVRKLREKTFDLTESICVIRATDDDFRSDRNETFPMVRQVTKFDR